jgi:hypothetical protein
MPRAVSRARFVSIALLCGPSILGTLGLCLIPAGIFANAFVVWEMVLALFMAATYGPVLLPVAAVLLVTSDTASETALPSRLAWGILAIGIVTTAVYHLYVIDIMDLP